MAFDLDETIRARRSVRGFLTDRPVPREVVLEALRLAQWAPSNCNVQPWRVFLASGAARDRVRTALLEAASGAESPQPDVPIDVFQDEYRRLQIACAVEMYTHMGVARDDGAGRMRAHLRNYELFDAPHLAVVCMKREFGVGVALDVGMWVQTFMLALWARGVGSCAQASLRLYPQVLHREMAVPEDLQILCGISFGYEDPSVPANRTRQKREPIEANVTFLDE